MIDLVSNHYPVDIHKIGGKKNNCIDVGITVAWLYRVCWANCNAILLVLKWCLDLHRLQLIYSILNLLIKA